jgi:hypothetical protein
MLRQLDQPGESEAAVGDLVVIAIESGTATGPDNPAADLGIEVDGPAVEEVAVVFAPPEEPIPERPGHLQAYLLAMSEGAATVRVTPLSGEGRTGATREYTVTVLPRIEP